MPIADVKITSRSLVCSTKDNDCEDPDIQLSRSWLRIAIAMVFAGQGMVFSLAINMTPPEYGSTSYWLLHGGLIFSSLLVVCFLGLPLFGSTIRMVRSRCLTIEGLFTVSLLGAFIGSLFSTFTGEGAVYYEIVSIVIAIYTIGRLIGSISQSNLGKQTTQIRECFGAATMRTKDGWMAVKVEDLPIGAIVRVQPGEPISVDGIISSGSAYVSETTLTGEALPVVRNMGDVVRAGTWSVDGLLEIKVGVQAGRRDLDNLLQRVDEQAGTPSKFEAQANRIIHYFLPFVVIISFLCFIHWLFVGSWAEAVFNSMAVLLVACPCALGLATPIGIWQGLLRLAKMGIISRDGALIDALAATRLIYFDKTGTLSDASMKVTKFSLVKEWEDRHGLLQAMIYTLESKLSHPIARAITNFLPQSDLPISNFKI
ncbi:MAG: HAD-IC family P-type ATPase, partial [Verrucomicrobiota bacterium]|nr:HAD-IC family P-type ATPase [Verrucomicrobiota bacterium]